MAERATELCTDLLTDASMLYRRLDTPPTQLTLMLTTIHRVNGVGDLFIDII